MLPVLKLASDGDEHRMSDVVDKLAMQLNLTETEREELLPSEKQPVFNTRVHWAKTYLAQAKLLIGTRRAFFKNHGAWPFGLGGKRRANRRQISNATALPDVTPLVEEKVLGQSTPDELLRATIKEVESALAAELIPRICAASPAFFRPSPRRAKSCLMFR